MRTILLLLTAVMLVGCESVPREREEPYWRPNPFMPEQWKVQTLPVIYTRDFSHCDKGGVYNATAGTEFGCVHTDIQYGRIICQPYVDPFVARYGDGAIECAKGHEEAHCGLVAEQGKPEKKQGPLLVHDNPTMPQFRVDCGDGTVM